MRIVFIGHSGHDYPHTRVRCYGFAKALKEKGFDTEVLSFKDHLAKHRTEEDMYAHLRDRDKLALIRRAIGRLWKDRRNLLYVQKAHFHTAAPFLLSRYAGARYILDYDDYDVELSNFFVKGRWSRLCFGTSDWAEITRRVARRASACVVSSHGIEEFLGEYNNRIVRVETGVDTENFHPPREEKPADAPVTFFWNGLVWGEEIVRSVHLAMEAFSKVHRIYPNTQLLVIGGGFQWSRLIGEAREKYSGVPIVFRGWMPPTAMPSVLREVDVGLLPFGVDNRWVRCKSPTKMFEYLASGLPVVAWNLGEVRHVIEEGKNGLLVEDAEEMAAAMGRLAGDAELRRNLSTAARETAVTRYSHEVLGEKLAHFLRDLAPTLGMQAPGS
jgi:glycosyltransferase involved in cell wall biosynthesis